MNETVAGIIKELIATANGQIRLVGAVMCIGPAYFTFMKGLEPTNFDFAVLAVGAFFITMSAGMAIYRAMIESKAAPIVNSLEPSERMEKFSKEVLSSPKNKKEISESHYSEYKGMRRDHLEALLNQTTANECVASGIALATNGLYLDNNATNATVFIK